MAIDFIVKINKQIVIAHLACETTGEPSAVWMLWRHCRLYGTNLRMPGDYKIDGRRKPTTDIKKKKCYRFVYLYYI
jgi:hypothetical protein